MIRHLGYIAANFTIEASTARTCRLAGATPDRLRALIAANLDDLERVFAFNVERDVHLYRLSSQVIPFASHPINTIAWWDEFAGPLGRLKDVATRHAIRASMHPGQYTVLNSPSAGVVAASVAELVASARLLDAIQADAAGKIVLHVGGAYGDRDASLRRFEEVARGLPTAVSRRLVIENDDTVYPTDEVLDLARAVGVPVVFDWFHHTLRPSADPDHTTLIGRCFDTWTPEDGIPKAHISSQSDGGRVGHHAEYINPADLAAFLAVAPDRPFDLMVEAKAKDLALLRLRDQVQTLLPARSPDPVQKG